ncbi:alpha/beta fold hydrolase [Corynebacterium caspium]|uniref:alpha/beta fold hydrolase n=1 Tax=Corynebacterium caspium TaxID=234828 RepID=UPI00037D6E38|nr:alpha/beta fold hydrolase [Corynebacterium caspium]WKD59534.1 Proline iminopeptidase [Corynebacterium caspium DSM 44850]
METRYFADLRFDEITLEVPLTPNSTDPRKIDIFARIISRREGEHLPFLFFLQGGPGSEAPRPRFDGHDPSWLRPALERYRVVMVDQRGTGRSTPVGDKLLETGSAAEVAEYLSYLRADGIVRDCEALREELGAAKINLLGQSFGGFTTLHYLSVHPDSLDNVYITGGLPAIGRPTEDIYALTFEKMRYLSENYYRRFPAHREKVKDLVARAARGEIILPSGEVVSPSRMRGIGFNLGGDVGWENLYWLLELDPDSNAFRHDLAAIMPYGTRNPIYYVLHESSYADGVVTNWSAQRVQPADFAADTSLFYGEHVFQEWTNTVPELQPWKEVTDILAQWEWPTLFDPEVLQSVQVKGAAAVYFHDAYVPLEYSLETAQLLPDLRLFITSEHEHSGLRSSKGKILKHLFELADGTRIR